MAWGGGDRWTLLVYTLRVREAAVRRCGAKDPDTLSVNTESGERLRSRETRSLERVQGSYYNHVFRPKRATVWQCLPNSHFDDQNPTSLFNLTLASVFTRAPFSALQVFWRQCLHERRCPSPWPFSSCARRLSSLSSFFLVPPRRFLLSAVLCFTDLLASVLTRTPVSQPLALLL